VRDRDDRGGTGSAPRRMGALPRPSRAGARGRTQRRGAGQGDGTGAGEVAGRVHGRVEGRADGEDADQGGRPRATEDAHRIADGDDRAVRAAGRAEGAVGALLAALERARAGRADRHAVLPAVLGGRRRGPGERTGAIRVAAEAGEDAALDAEGAAGVVGGRGPGPRDGAAREVEVHRQRPDVEHRIRWAVVARRIRRVQRRRAWRAAHAVVGAAYARARRPGADRAGLDAGDGAARIGGGVAGEIEDGRQREAEGRRAGVAGEGAGGGSGDGVEDADAGRRAARVGHRERGAEEATRRGAGAVAAGLRRGGAAEAGRLAGAGGDGGDGHAAIGHGVRERNGVAAAAGVEAGAGEVRDQRAGAAEDVAAVAGRVDRREADRAGAIAARRNRRRRRARRGRGR